MAAVIDPPPADVRKQLDGLAAGLDTRIPSKAPGRNLLIGTWNLRAFGGLTPSWHSKDGDSPKRDWAAVHAIAEIVSRFDIVAVQECRDDTTALRALLAVLGPHWAVMTTDVTKGKDGNGERLAFLFDTRRVKPSGLACELVVPVETDPAKIKADAFNRQFARTPYAVSFAAGEATVVLVTLHVIWGKQPADRVGELGAIAEWLADWARKSNDWNENLIVLGDFNIDRLGDPLYEAFVSHGLWAPAEHNAIPRTIFDTAQTAHFYDQIAWFSDDRGLASRLTLGYDHRAGNVDFIPYLLGDMTRTELSWRISDHYPLWVEFGLPRP
ncbi:MAG TPA: endonuclease/exonuclease/phosphatase family protein [Mycobacteriales bacterium]|jgi:endonuclease/exonuclease/phosphatase family metal-dependent hydrolase|nr:endonuclease/exonuclease/phosphatase family protein [Mycobacteriales bacterium]